MNEEDKLILNGHELTSRFILGSGKYSLELIKAAVENAGSGDYHSCPKTCRRR